MFLPDVLHEFDSGVWRSTFIHLLRILLAINAGTLYELNRRYAIPICPDLFINSITI
jgi:hypothetical protein